MMPEAGRNSNPSSPTNPVGRGGEPVPLSRNPFRSQARLLSDDQLRGDLHLIEWLLRDGDDLSNADRQLLVWEKEAAEAELARRWDRGLTYPACDFGFDQAVIDRIKSAWPIEAVIGIDVDLHPAGKFLRGRCPLHDGKSETSLSVLPGVDGLWYCFGCQFGGDVFAWMMAFHRCEFSEALRRLALLVGEPLPLRRRPGAPQRPKPTRPAGALPFPKRRAS